MKTSVNQKLIPIVLFLVLISCSVKAQTNPTNAPGAPGNDAHWMSAGKQAVGTSNSLESKVWFTLEGGAMTEVFYPVVDTPNVRLLQFVVVNKKTGKIETERDDTEQKVDSGFNSLFFQQINKSKSGEWILWKKYTIDPQRNTILINVNFTAENQDLALYVYYDPSLNNSGMHDTAWTQNGFLFAQDSDKVSILSAKEGFGETVNGFFGISDGLTQLQKNKKLIPYERAENGNVVQFAELKSKIFKLEDKVKGYNLALSFGKNADEALKTNQLSLRRGFLDCLKEYNAGWHKYLQTIPKVEQKYQAQFEIAAMILKAHEDKTFLGASVASLSNPWGGGNNSNETTSGYHLVWSRDLYHVATAFMALGDKHSAMLSLDYLFKYQQKPDGSFPQITWLDGRTVGDSIQMDEVSYPLILAYQLGKTDRITYEKNIKKSADYIVKNGPKSQQERWEEKSGYSPSTIAAEIAGLVCAAEIARLNSDKASAAIYLKTADDWANKVEFWTATKTGKYGDGNYYLRLTKNGTPDAGDKIELYGTFDEREIVDAGFVELVRFGIKSPFDSLIIKSLKVVDEQIRVETPNGEAWYRFNHDGYGETYDGKRWNWDGNYKGKGHLWALLTGERGQFEISKCQTETVDFKLKNTTSTSQDQCLAKAKLRLDSMVGFANESLMLPEQIWDKQHSPNADLQFMPQLKFGEGTGSATPLAWTCAQFIRLAVNLQYGKNLDTPEIVAKHFANLSQKIKN